jgi:ribosomal protein S18 acetylase RimI-like enzyme
MPSFNLVVEGSPSQEDIRTLRLILYDYNSSKAKRENWQALYIFVRDENSQIVGGLIGYTHWGWLYVENLVVSEMLRGQGYGRALMLLAEEQAIQRGCNHAYLDTFDFQARGFYEKIGYEVFGVLEDYPRGHIKYFLRKNILETAQTTALDSRSGTTS